MITTGITKSKWVEAFGNRKVDFEGGRSSAASGSSFIRVSGEENYRKLLSRVAQLAAKKVSKKRVNEIVPAPR